MPPDEPRVTPDPPEEPEELPDRTAGDEFLLEPVPLLTAEDPVRLVAPERTTVDPEALDRLVALRLTAVRIASRLRSSDPEELADLSVRMPISDCLPCTATLLPDGDLSPERDALLSPVLRGP